MEKTKSSGMDVISLKGGTTHAPAAVIAVMAEAIIKERNRVMGASVVPDGEYNLRNVSVGLPVVLGEDGVERIIELDLDDVTRGQLMRAASQIQSIISQTESM